MNWLHSSSSNTESTKQKLKLLFRMLGSTFVGLLMAIFILSLFLDTMPKNLLANSNCDAKCSETLIIYGFLTILPNVFVAAWAALTYFTEITIQRKFKDIPKRSLGSASILILLLGGITCYDITRRFKLSEYSYFQAINDWRVDNLKKETIESFSFAIQKIKK